MGGPVVVGWCGSDVGVSWHWFVGMRQVLGFPFDWAFGFGLQWLYLVCPWDLGFIVVVIWARPLGVWGFALSGVLGFDPLGFF